MNIDDKFMLMGGAGMGKAIPIPWRRSNEVLSEDRFTCDRICALKFKARTNIIVYGFLWTEELHKKAFTLKVKFRIDEGEWSDEFEVSPID